MESQKVIVIVLLVPVNLVAGYQQQFCLLLAILAAMQAMNTYFDHLLTGTSNSKQNSSC